MSDEQKLRFSERVPTALRARLRDTEKARDEAFAKGKQAFELQRRAETEAARLRRENEAAASTIDGLRQRLEQVAAERDALRHVVSEAKAMGFLTPSAESGADHRALCEFARDLPTSLARRDARVKAEALEAVVSEMEQDADFMRGHKWPDEVLLAVAAEYRKQAEQEVSS